MSTAESRPLPLRVPVTEVTQRSSIVGGARRSRDAASPSLVSANVVVQRAVRYISDPPPGSEMTSYAPSSVAPSARPLPAVTAQAGSAAQREGPVSSDIPTPTRGLKPSNDQASLEPGTAQPNAAAPVFASAPEGALAPDGRDEQEASFDGDDDEPAELLEVSLPPPAPPEALRRPSSSPAPRSDSSPGRPAISHNAAALAPRAGQVRDVLDNDTSGERESIEEIELEPDARVLVEPGRLQSPPPPPLPARASLPALPDLSTTLTRSARVQELRPTKPRSHAWWEVFFDDDYLRTVRAPTRKQIANQCDFIEKRLGLKPGATLLDVACGLGQQVIELTARGYASVGVDLSLAMLSRASEEAQSRNMRINFLHADMRDLSFEANFDAVTCLGTSLGYFDDDTNRKVMERLLRALKPGGVLLLDVVNRDYVIRSQPNLIWFEGEGCVCMEESEFNFFTSRLHVKRTVILDTGRQLENEYSLRLYSLHELGQLLNASGFRVSEVSGRDALPGVFFGQESPNLMIVAERRPDAPASPSEDKA